MDTTESRDFANRLAELLKNERHAMADFLVALAEFDRQRGWLELGHSGLFPFLHRQLGLSKAASFFRMKAAELIQRYPEIVEPLREGRLCITTMASLSKVLTQENRYEVLPRFFHRSGVEAKAIVAELAPAPNPPTRTVVSVTPVRTSPAHRMGKPMAEPPRGSPGEPRGLGKSATDEVPEPFTLQPAQPLRASAEDVLVAGLDLLLERDAKRKGLVAKPRPLPDDASPELGATHVPAAVRREVWKRDQGCCQWKLDSGGVCGSKVRLELDHINLRCRGAKPIPSELRVLCDFHNQLSARLALGDEGMDRYTRNPRQRKLL